MSKRRTHSSKFNSRVAMEVRNIIVKFIKSWRRIIVYFKSLRKNRLTGRGFSSGALIALRSNLFSAIQRVGAPDFRRCDLLGPPDRGLMATPLGNHLFMVTLLPSLA